MNMAENVNLIFTGIKSRYGFWSKRLNNWSEIEPYIHKTKDIYIKFINIQAESYVH